MTDQTTTEAPELAPVFPEPADYDGWVVEQPPELVADPAALAMAWAAAIEGVAGIKGIARWRRRNLAAIVEPAPVFPTGDDLAKLAGAVSATSGALDPQASALAIVQAAGDAQLLTVDFIDTFRAATPDQLAEWVAVQLAPQPEPETSP